MSKFDWLALAPVCLALSACGAGEVAVKEAAQQRWNALIEGDYRTAYKYYTDAFKQEVTLHDYKGQIKGVGLWNKAQVDTVECDAKGERCDAQVAVTVGMKMRGLPEIIKTTDVVHEIWVKGGLFSDWRYLKK